MVRQGKSEYAPNYRVSPGLMILKTIEALGINQAELARRMGRHEETISNIINNKQSITQETALQLERASGVPAYFWTNVQNKYVEHELKEKEKTEIAGKLEVLDKLPTNEMVKYGWILKRRDKTELVIEILNKLKFASIDALDKYVVDTFNSNIGLLFRKSDKYIIDRYSLAIWLRIGELEAEKSLLGRFDKRSFRNVVENNIRMIPMDDVVSFFNMVAAESAVVGVAVVVVPELRGIRTSGLCRSLSRNRALIQLSLRYKTADQLLFSFFHEAAHLVIHGLHGKDHVDIEQMGKCEEEANDLACEWLIPQNKYRQFVQKQEFTGNSIILFSEEVRVPPGIVVGRLQHDGHLSFNSSLNSLKVRLEWKVA